MISKTYQEKLEKIIESIAEIGKPCRHCSPTTVACLERGDILSIQMDLECLLEEMWEDVVATREH